MAYIPWKIRKKLVVSLILPHFTYCLPLLTDLPVTQTIRLRRALNACIRFICKVGIMEHITPYYPVAGIPDFLELRNRTIAFLIVKIIRFGKPVYLREQFKFLKDVQDRTGRKHQLSLALSVTARTQKYNSSFLFEATRIWNKYKLYDILGSSHFQVKKYIHKSLVINARKEYL